MLLPLHGALCPLGRHFVASKVGKTGLAVTVDVYNPARTKVVDGGSATEVGGGLYTYTHAGAGVTSDGNWRAVFKTADGTVDQQHLPALIQVGRAGTPHLDADVSSRLASASYTVPPTVDAIWDGAFSGHLAGTADYALGTIYTRVGSGLVTYVGPVPEGGAAAIVRGDSYTGADALSWNSETWRDLTAATVTLTVRKAGAVILTRACTVVGAGAATQYVYAALSASDTELPIGSHPFDIQASWAGGAVETLVSGVYLTVAEDQTRPA